MKKILSVLLAVSMFLSIAASQAVHPSAAQSIPEGFDQTVAEFADGIGLGWNLGNTLDSHDRSGYFGSNPTPAQIEQFWANPLTSKAIFEKVKEAGFNSVRIPVTWYNFTGSAPDYIIRNDWMSRVQEVVDYAMDLDLYVIINVHHDDNIEGGWLWPTTAAKATALDRLGKIWKQIADNFKDYPSNLILEGMNEVGNSNGWLGTAESRAIVNEFNQEFVDTVRSTGGNNPFRYLMCPTHAAGAIDEVFSDLVLPDDDRLMLSVHIYDQNLYDFEMRLIKMKNLFIEQGIPVIIGEWGTTSDVDINTRTVHAGKYISLANQYGAKCFWWDDGGKLNLLNRRTLQWRYPVILNAIMESYERPYEDAYKYVLKWTSSLNAYWGGSPTYHDDGSMNIAWAGSAGGGGKQNQYASKFTLGAAVANGAIARAKKEGKTIEFTIKLLRGTNKDGLNLTSVQVLTAQSIPSNGTWINMGEEKTIRMDVSDFTTSLNSSSVLQLMIQNYSISSMYDVEIWISPITVSD